MNGLWRNDTLGRRMESGGIHGVVWTMAGTGRAIGKSAYNVLTGCRYMQIVQEPKEQQ